MTDVLQVSGTVLVAGTGLAAAVALCAWVLAARGRASAVPLARRALVAAAALALGAGALLQVALVWTGSLPYAERVTTEAMPVYYRVTSMWSALEGSLLLWLLVLAVVAAVASLSLAPAASAAASTSGPTSASTSTSGSTSVSAPVASGGPIAGATLAAVVVAFTGVTLMGSPFSPAAGGGAPSPLLQDHVAMGIHPPLLYLGFATTAVPYAWAVAAAIGGGADREWVARVRRWTLISWVFLTAGIALGAWWSYAVLGWGGYWAWDPVENASLFPWLTATALLHLLVAGRGGRAVDGSARGLPGRGVVALAGLGFVLVVLAQFLTRSGVVQSIHAFSDSPFGPVYFAITVATVLPWLLTLRRVPAATPATGLLARLTSLQAVLLLVIGVIVLIGTLLPAILAATTGRLVAVGPPWYERTLAPIALALLVLLAVSLYLPARGADVRGVLYRMRFPLIAAGIVVGVVAVLVEHVAVALAAGLVAHLAVGLVLDLARNRSRRRLAAAVSHLGIAVAALAVVAGGLEVVREETLPVGGTVTAGNASATLVHLDRAEQGRRIVARADVVLGRGERTLGTAQPELRWYEAQGTMLTSPAIRTGALDDVYVTLLDVDPTGGTATVRLAVTPLISWLWSASGLLVVGGLLALLPGRRRRDRQTPAGPAAARPAEVSA